MEQSVILQHADRLWLAIAALVAGLALVLWGYRKSNLRGWRKPAAMGCKIAVWLILAFCLLEPMLSREVPRRGANELVLLADNSAGMRIAEAASTPTRAEALMESLAPQGQEAPWISDLAGKFRLRSMMFDERLHSVKSFASLGFDGRQSNLCASVKSLREGGAARSQAAIVVFTDGNATDASGWTELGDKGAPVFPIVVGAKSPARDLTLTDVTVTQSAFEDTPITVSARVTASGFQGREALLCALDDTGKVIATEKGGFESDGSSRVFRLRVPSTKPGLSFYRLAVLDAALQPKLANDEWKKLTDEATLQNNGQTIAVDRGAGPYRVMYVSGRPNWEYKFLRRALAGDEEIQMPSLIRIAKREPKFEWRGRVGETSNPLFRGFKPEGGDEAQRYDQPVLIRLGTKDKQELQDGFPKAAEDLFGEYRAIVLDDIEAGFFTQEQMNLIEKFVSVRGGALLMLGGQECYQAGGYEHTPVGRMLPVYLDRVARGAPVEFGRFNLTREGMLEPWTRLRSQQDEDETRLAQMPEFFSVNQIFSIKPGASVLATVTDAGQKNHPAWVAQRFGEGRVASVLIGDLWRWGMNNPGQHADMDKAWRQMMRWLVVDVPDRLVLTPRLSKTGGQDQALLQVRVRNAAFHPVDDATVKFDVEAPEGKKATLFAEPSLTEPGLYEASYFPRDEGAYKVAAEIKNAEGQVLGQRIAGWALNPLAEEFASLAPNRELLQRMAADTGGQMLEFDGIKNLPDLLSDLNVPVKEIVTEPLWHSPWILALLIGLLVSEWILRRKGGSL